MRIILALLLVASCASCRPLRSNDICIIDSDNAIADCAKLKKKYQLSFPEKMIGWSAFDVGDFLFLANVLEECEQNNGKLPASTGNPLLEMDICVIESQQCGTKSLRALDDYYAIDELTLRRVKQRINNCLK